MIRTFVLCLSLLGLSILLSSAVLSFLALEDEPAGERELPGAASTVTTVTTTAATTLLGQQGSSLPRPSRPISDAGYRPFAVVLAEPSELGLSVAIAIDEQVSMGLREFVVALAGDEQRGASIMIALSNAYADRAANRAIMFPLGSGGMDPNFVVNALQGVLDSDELTQLETFLQDLSRKSFAETYSPQIDLISPQLEAGNKQLLLDTLFVETYAATNPDGNTAGQTNDFLAKQLDAIRLTRGSIRGAVQGSQFELANDFLNEQEAGLNKAVEIFSPPTNF
jgi:hypothetical protein